MKNRIYTLLALLMMAATGAWAQDVSADTHAEIRPKDNGQRTIDNAAAKAPRRAVANQWGDEVKRFFCTEGQQYGVCTDGEYIYTTSWEGSSMYQYDLEGNFIETFTINGVSDIRDLAYDGTYFYGSNCSNTVYILDMAGRTMVGTIYIPASVRGLTYDPSHDGFWTIDGWDGAPCLYDRDGNLLMTGKTPGGISGCAYFEDTDGEEHVLLYCQNDDKVYDYNITNNSLDGAVNYISYNGSSTGSCFIGEYGGQVCFFADIQYSPNIIRIFPLLNAGQGTGSGYSLKQGTNEHGTIAFAVEYTNVRQAEAGAEVTVTITPESGWRVDQVTATTVTTWGGLKAPRRAGSIDILGDVEVSGKGNTWKFTMPAADVKVSVSYIKQSTITFEPATEHVTVITDGDTLTVTDSKVDVDENVRVVIGGNAGYVPWGVVMTTYDRTDYIQVGNSTSSHNYYPTYEYYNYSLSEQIYTPEEIGQSGTIREIGFYFYGSLTREWDIYLAHTSQSAFESNSSWVTVTDADKVFSGSVSYISDGWTYITFDTPFEYNGTDNLVVVVDDNSGWYNSSQYCAVFSTETNQAITTYSDNTNFNPTSPPNGHGGYTNVKNVVQLGFKVDAVSTVLEPTDSATYSFTMPEEPIKVTYTSEKRDISYGVDVVLGDYTRTDLIVDKREDNDKYSIRLGEEYIMPTLTDTLDVETPVLTLNEIYTRQLQQQDSDGEWQDYDASEGYEPGYYRWDFTAINTTDYAGKTQSAVFELRNFYLLTVPAGEFATYYNEDALTLGNDTEGAVTLYTVAGNTDSEVVLSSAIGTAPSLTPLLIYNEKQEDDNIKLYIAESSADEVTAADIFKGTLEDAQIAASTDETSNYALNGKYFVKVEEAMGIAANRCWLEVTSTASARAISIFFPSGETSAIESIDNKQGTEDNLYDVSGLKLQKTPTQKGIYINNGRKVVIK